MSFITILNASIPIVWVVVMISFFLTSIILKRMTKQKVVDSFGNGFFLYIIVWKLSYIVFSYEHFITMPLSILYFHGGKYGHFLALLAVTFYFYFIGKKKDPNISLQIRDFTINFIIIYEIILNIFHYAIIPAILHLFVYSLYFFIKRKNWHKRLHIQSFIVIFLIQLTIISIFESIFTIQTLTFVIFIILSLLVSYQRDGEKYE